ncbi:hypothetical protein V6N00_13260 [Tersicoccus sp. MR15.9]|uniref:hypothetical protein n=1 Tax=Tersicoccus mangrovi TaxID=3121635 RepID=UPI002FE65A38
MANQTKDPVRELRYELECAVATATHATAGPFTIDDDEHVFYVRESGNSLAVAGEFDYGPYEGSADAALFAEARDRVLTLTAAVTAALDLADELDRHEDIVASAFATEIRNRMLAAITAAKTAQ